MGREMQHCHRIMVRSKEAEVLSLAQWVLPGVTISALSEEQSWLLFVTSSSVPSMANLGVRLTQVGRGTLWPL